MIVYSQEKPEKDRGFEKQRQRKRDNRLDGHYRIWYPWVGIRREQEETRQGAAGATLPYSASVVSLRFQKVNFKCIFEPPQFHQSVVTANGLGH